MPWNPLTPGSTVQQDDDQPLDRAGSDAVPSEARTANGDSGSLYTGVDTVSLLVDVTAVSGTTPSLALSVEWSHDGTTWFIPDPVDSFAPITGEVKVAKIFTAKAPFFRVVWTITGTTPSFTFAIHAYNQDN